MQKSDTNRISPLRIFILIAAAAVFCWAGYQLLGYFLENAQADKGNQSLIDQAVTIVETVGETTPTEMVDSNSEAQPSQETLLKPESDQTEIPISVDFALLQQSNPDIIAWIYCPDSPINYPVVQAEDNQYYLGRLPDGTYNSAGTIFADFRNGQDLSDRHTLIYGHNMRNDSMFSCLSGYRKQEYYEEHPVMWLITPKKAYCVELFAGFVTRADSDSYSLFDTDADLHNYVEKIIDESTFDAPVDLSQINQIVTLSTCTYEGVDKRYIVIGAMHEIEITE